MKRPVFVVGAPRSGTTLLHHMLLSAGGFAVYETESSVFNLLVPMFGDLRNKRNKRELMTAWLQSHHFRLSGLRADSIERRILAECNSGGDFLRILMEEIARSQAVDRWSEHTPAHLFYIREIKQYFPDALIVHVIRDGRDVALSLDKQGWVRPLPGQSHARRAVVALYWYWMVRKGREYGKSVAPDYLEVRYEDLVLQPRATLARLSQFIQHDLEYDHIQKVAIGTVAEPNTSFPEQSPDTASAVGRWDHELGDGEALKLEHLTGDLLVQLGYSLRVANPNKRKPPELILLRALYLTYFNSKLWLRKHTPLPRYFAATGISGPDRRLDP